MPGHRRCTRSVTVVVVDAVCMVFTHAAYAGDVRIRGLERAHRVTRGRVSQVCTLFIHNSGAAVTSSQQGTLPHGAQAF